MDRSWDSRFRKEDQFEYLSFCRSGARRFDMEENELYIVCYGGNIW